MTLRILALPLIASLPFFAMSACSEQPGGDESAAAPGVIEDTAPPPQEQPGEEATESPTIGGDGSAIVLTRLSDGDIRQATNLDGELGCTFTRTAGGPALLVAMADVAGSEGAAPGRGLIKIGDVVEQITATGGGGFSAMAESGEFAAKGLTIDIDETGEEPASGHESPPMPARMEVQRADGASRTLAGFWTCGP